MRPIYPEDIRNYPKRKAEVNRSLDKKALRKNALPGWERPQLKELDMESLSNVYIVRHAHLAKYKVFYVEHIFQQRNAHLLAGATLVDHEHLANLKLYIVKHASQADILITQANFPKPSASARVLRFR